jgi:hypothetical protein
MGIAFNFIKSALKIKAPKPASTPHPNGWRVWFEEDGRSGRIGFEGEGRSFSMYFEFGGGDVVVIIDVPPPAKWEVQTHILLEKRLPILNFVGSETVRQKASGCRYELSDNAIYILT